MKFLVFAASHRKESFNQKLAKLAAKHIESAGHAVVSAEYEAFDMPIYNDERCIAEGLDSQQNRFAALAREVDGIVVCSPEYNWSYPGSLKNTLDWTSCIKPPPLKGKTVLLMCATPGPRGGIAGLMHLKSPFEALQASVYSRVFPLSHAPDILTDEGLRIPKMQQDFVALIEDYIIFTRKLTN